MTIQLRPVPLHVGTPGTPGHKLMEWWEGKLDSHGWPTWMERHTAGEAIDAVESLYRRRLVKWGPEAPKSKQGS